MRLNGQEIVVNPELIEWVDAHPDTTLSLATGSKIIVTNSVDDVIERILAYRRAISASGHSPTETLLKSYKREIS